MKLLNVFLIISIFIGSDLCVHGGFNITDIGKSVADTVKGVISKIPDAIPKPEQIFQSAKNLVAGYPFDALFSAINQFCKNTFIIHVFSYNTRLFTREHKKRIKLFTKEAENMYHIYTE